MKWLYMCCVFFGLLASCRFNDSLTNLNLQDKLYIEYEFLNDSLCFGDTVLIYVKFINKSSSSIFIYPKAVVMLELIIDTTSSRLICLNETCQDYESVSKINGFSSIDIVYKVSLERSFFVYGENNTCVLYRAFRQGRSIAKKYNPLIGYVNSQIRILHVCND